MASLSEQDELNVAMFISMVPQASSEDAVRLLQATGGDVDAAVIAFHEQQQQVAPSARPAAATAGTKAKRETAAAANQYYAGGGNSSGQAIVAPPPPKREVASSGSDDDEGTPGPGGAVGKLFRHARESGARDVTASGHEDAAFQGTGRRLGHLPGPSPVMAPLKRRVVKVRITFYKNGFLVNDETQLRDPQAPDQKEFLAQLQKGVVPREIAQNHPMCDVDVVLVDHAEDEFRPPQYVAYAGHGRTLGAPAAAAAASAARAGAPGPESTQPAVPPPSSFEVIDSEDKCKVVLLLPDGSRHETVVNPKRHTINDLRGLACGAACLAAADFDLIARDFPKHRPLDDVSQTIEAAKCKNGVVMVQLRK